MSFEPKPANPTQNPLFLPQILPPRYTRSTSKPFTPTSLSPRYRSPTLSTLLQSNPSPLPCSTCEKRLNPSNPQIFHDSPPKIRPSHHNIVNNNCSQGSYSKILKVICLNEPRPSTTETKKIKIIENSSEVKDFKNFDLTGFGTTVQVVYEEVMMPPKPELTCLVMEMGKDEDLGRFREEERKRVCIRRAEYANRVKGVSRTVVETFVKGEEVDRVVRRSSMEFEVHEKDAQDKVTKKKVKQKKVSGKGFGKSKRQMERGRFNEERGRDQLGEKKDEVRSGSRGRGREVVNGEKEEGQNKSRERRMNYFKQIRDESLKRGLEQSKISVKHKILAKLAEKDFAQFIDKHISEKKSEISEEKLLSSENSVFCEGSLRQQQDDKIKDSFIVFERINKSEDFKEEMNFEGFSEKVNESERMSLRFEAKECPRIEEASERSEDSREKSKESRESDEKGKIIEGVLSEDNKDFKYEILQIIEKSPKPVNEISESDEKSSETATKHSDTIENPKNMPGNYSESAEITPNTIEKHLETYKLSPQVSENSKLFEKTPSPPSESPKGFFPDPSTPNSSSSENVEFCSVSIDASIQPSPQSSIFQSPKLESYKSLKKHLDYIGNPFEDSPSGQINILNDSQEMENISCELTNQLNLEDINQTMNLNLDDQGIKNSTGMKKDNEFEEDSEKINVLNQMQRVPGLEFLMNSFKVESPEDNIKELSPKDLNSVLDTLTDPMVIKGLRILGSFADYLEQFGVNILDFK